jgi:CheY-like chemotaxis protein
MSFKRALVVDDSRSARLALKALLDQHNLIVHFAESGEEALDFLKRQIVDVIFMDHSMPGMDGLEAVSVIKKDPRTAMIPVMMYTAKEGEVYVGQARALGAVGVLPKQVQPGVLFDMLLKLGLVKERRTEGRARKAAIEEEEEQADAVDQELERQAMGMSVQALVSRILQDQHTELRLDILSSQRDFAKQVAAEILAKQEADRQQAEPPPAPKPDTGPGVTGGLAFALGVTALVLGVLLWQTRGERDAALAENAHLASAAEQQFVDAESQSAGLISSIEAERERAELRYLSLLDTLQWAVNQSSQVPFDEVALNGRRLESLRELLARLDAVGFVGTVRLDAHLGEFCLQTDASGGYRLADSELPIHDCSLIGHPLDDSDSVSDRQSVSFANFLASSPLVNRSGIDVQLVAHSRRDSVRRYAFPADIRSAGEWNEIAELNNRIEYTLIAAAP